MSGSENDRGNLGFFTLIAGTGGTEIVFRTVPELVGLGDSITVPILAQLLVFETVLTDTVGWVLGWLLFWLFVFYFAPEFYPRQWLDTAAGLPARVTTATGVVATGALAEWGLTELVLNVSVSPLPAPTLYGLVGGAGVLALGFALVSVLPEVGTDSGMLHTPSEATLELYDEMGRGAFVVRALLLVVVLGTLFAEVSLLYPIPEIYLLAIVARESLDVVFETDGVVLTREDLAERAAIGATGVWAPAQFALIPLYGTVILFSTLVITLLSVFRIDQSLVASYPVAITTYAFTMIAGVVYVVVYVTRIFSRLPPRIQATATGGPDGATEIEPSRTPGFLFPAALAVGVGMIVAESARSLPPSYVALGLAGGLIALLAAYDEPNQRIRVSDDLAVPVATSTAYPSGILLVAILTGQPSLSLALLPLVFVIFAFLFATPGLIIGAVAYRRRHSNPEPMSEAWCVRRILTVFALSTAIMWMALIVQEVPLGATEISDLIVGAGTLVFLVGATWGLYLTYRYRPTQLVRLVRQGAASTVGAPRWVVGALRRQIAKLTVSPIA